MKISTKFKLVSLATISTVLMNISAAVFAEGNPDIGKLEYDSHCAACHGLTGKGDDSALKGELVKSIPDLTVLSKKNNGVFPFNTVYQIIDGRTEIKSHGSREMPIWGLAFKSEASPYFEKISPYDNSAIVRSRILALTEYLHRIQVK